jgi:GT2 family glycosyltransferase/glycosyltransferase involved in cell wall biosynthesis
VADREAQLAALRRARLAVGDEQLVADHVAKLAEIARLDAEAAESTRDHVPGADTRTQPADPSTGHLARAAGSVARPVRRLGHLVSLVGPAIRYSGGLRGAVRRAVGLVRREGLSGIRYGVQVADHSREPSAEQLAAVLQRRITLSPPWYSDDDPEISLVVLNANDTARTIDCLRSVWQHTAGHRYEIVVVDNGSRAEDFAQLAQLEGPCRIIRLPVRRADGEAHNLGVEAATGRVLGLLGHDVTVTYGWLEPLMDVLDSTPDSGAVGPKVVSAGVISAAGGLVDESGRIVARGRFRDQDDPAYGTSTVVDYVSPDCTLVRTEDFVRVLGYDLTYGSGYEHADICLKLSRLGLQVYYAPGAVVVRHGSVPAGVAGDAGGLTEVNRAKFLARWGGYLRTGRHTPPPETTPVLTCASAEGKLTAGVYTAHPLTPGGGERYVLGLISQLQRLGYHVRLITPAPYSRMRVTALARIFDIAVDGLCLSTLEEAARLAPFDDFVAMGIELVPPVAAMGRRNTFLCQFPFPTPDEEVRRRAAWYAGYDRVLVYSAFVEQAMSTRASAAGLRELPIEIVSPAVPLSPRPIATDKSGILSVGRFFVGGHSKRQDLQIAAFRQLVESGRAGDAVLHLVGSSSTERENRAYVRDCIAAAEGLPVEFHIDAGADVLDGLYETCSLFWHSSGLGVDVARDPERCEHFGISPIEAMSYGTIPLVVGNGGPAAIITDGIDGYHYDDVAELVSKTARLLALTEEQLGGLRIAARTRSADYGDDAFAARVGEVFSR